jgi:hypothetical protein
MNTCHLIIDQHIAYDQMLHCEKLCSEIFQHLNRWMNDFCFQSWVKNWTNMKMFGHSFWPQMFGCKGWSEHTSVKLTINVQKARGKCLFSVSVKQFGGPIKQFASTQMCKNPDWVPT